MKRTNRYCSNCRDWTDQLAFDSEHERDSSSDYQICLKCHYHYSGMSGEWREPDAQDLEYEKSLTEFNGTV